MGVRESQLIKDVEALKPWPTSIYLGSGRWTRKGVGMIKTSWYVDTMEEAFGSLDGKRLLDIGSNSGYVALEAALRGASVHSIEPHAKNYERCKLVYSAYDLLSSRITLTREKMEDLSLAQNGKFDGIFFCSTINHLEKPWNVMAALATMSDVLLVESRLATQHDVNFVHEGLPYFEVREVGSNNHPLHRVESGMTRKPTRRTLIGLLRNAGYSRIHQMIPCAGLTDKYQVEECVSFIGTKHQFRTPGIAGPNKILR